MYVSGRVASALFQEIIRPKLIRSLPQGSDAVLPFDWDEVPKDDPAARAFFDDAADYDVGPNGLSIPVRNRKGVRSLVSFTSNHSKDDWAEYKSRNMVKLQPMAVLIDSAAGINFKLTPEPVELSKTEEECLIWAVRGKTYHDIAGLLNLSFASVKTYLDTARHKLSCINLTHAVADRDWRHTGKSTETAVLTRRIAGRSSTPGRGCERWPNSSPRNGDLKPSQLTIERLRRQRDCVAYAEVPARETAQGTIEPQTDHANGHAVHGERSRLCQGEAGGPAWSFCIGRRHRHPRRQRPGIEDGPAEVDRQRRAKLWNVRGSSP